VNVLGGATKTSLRCPKSAATNQSLISDSYTQITPAKNAGSSSEKITHKTPKNHDQTILHGTNPMHWIIRALPKVVLQSLAMGRDRPLL